MQISLSFASAEICTQTNDRENNKRLVQVSPTYAWADQRLREHDYPPALLRPEFRNAAARVLAKHRGLKTRIKMMNNTQTSRIVAGEERSSLSRKCADGRGVYVIRVRIIKRRLFN